MIIATDSSGEGSHAESDAVIGEEEEEECAAASDFAGGVVKDGNDTN